MLLFFFLVFVITILCCIILGDGTRRNRSAIICFCQLCASYQYRNLAYEMIYTESMLTRYRVTLYRRTRVLLVRVWFGISWDSREIRAKLRLSPFLFVESGNNIFLSYYTPIANRSWDKYTREPSFFLSFSSSFSLSLSLSSRIRTSTRNICIPVHASLFISY